MRKKAAEGLDLTIPKVKNPARKRRCERDIFLWLKTYLSSDFSQPFTDDQKRMITDILLRAKHGGYKAIAAARGDGKTIGAEGVILFCMLLGILRFPVIVAATGPDASRILKHIKNHLERNDVLLEDYPEVCFPIRSLDGAPQRAGTQTVNGNRTFLEWGQDHIVLPTVRINGRKSRASGAALTTRGLDAAIRGLRINEQRPDFILIDDPETRESVKSEEQTKTRRLIIEEDLGGLGAGDGKMGFVMLTTIMRRSTNEGGPTISFEYTDIKLRPAWEGVRFRQLIKSPVRTEMWDEYIRLIKEDQLSGDKDTSRARKYYADNFEAMNLGAVVSNPNRFNRRLLPDGTQTELSAVQRCYNIIADRGEDHFKTEYQNDPPEDERQVDRLLLTSHHIQHNCLSGLDRRVIPPETALLTIGGDLQKLGLHWVLIASNDDVAGCVVDYDFFQFAGTEGRPAADCELAILEGLFAWHDAMQANPYYTADGEEYVPDFGLLDMGWKEESWNIQPVNKFCSAIGFANFMPSKGIPNYRRPNDSRQIVIGDNWHIAWPGGTPLVEMNSDHWKLKVHEGFLCDRGRSGSLTLFNHPRPDGRVNRNFHLSLSKHILAESWETRAMPGFRGQRTGWWKSTKPNHWFDAMYQAIVARSVRGMNTLESASEAKLAATAPHDSSNETNQFASVLEPAPRSTRYY